MRGLCSLLFCVLLCGCESTTRKQYVQEYVNVPITEIQINAVPKPLDMNGFYPYMVWINGKHSGLNPGQAKCAGIKFTASRKTHALCNPQRRWLASSTSTKIQCI